MSSTPPPSKRTETEIDGLRQRITELEHELRAAAASGVESAREREALAQQAQLLDLAHDTIMVRRLDGVILSWNKGAERMYGLTREQAVGRISHELLATEFPAPLHEIERTLIERGRWEGELRHAGRHGPVIVASRWALRRDARGEPEAVLEINSDITARKEAEAEREQQAAMLRQQGALLDLAQDAIIVRRTDGTVLYWNRGAEQMYGHTAAEAIGARTHDLLRTRFAAGDLAAAEAALGAHGHWEGELVHTRRDGTAVSVDSRWVAHQGADDETVAVMELNTDITARKEAEAERNCRQEDLIRIRAQEVAIAELSTPLIPITDDVVVMPLVGAVDTFRAQQVMSTLLDGLASSRATVAILDITGVRVVDTHVANSLLRAAQGARLLGVEVVVTGIRPDVAHTLVNLGTGLGDLVTRGTLQSGIAHAMRKRRAGGS